MMKVNPPRIIIVLYIGVFALLPTKDLFSCTCIFSPSSFCTSITEAHKLVLTEYVKASGLHDAWYRVLEGINNDLEGDTILILGQDGWNCNDYAYYGVIYDTLLLAIEGDGPEYALDGCGRFYAVYERDTLKDDRIPNREVMAYSDFLANLAECQALVEYRPGSGRIVHWRDTTEGVSDLFFQINGFELQTDQTGYYEFAKIPIQAEYFGDWVPGVALKPKAVVSHLQSVSTADLTAIQKHILGIKTFERPEQYLAADVDASRHVSVMDVLWLRRIILNIDPKFPGGQSWRFVPLDYEFPNTQNPWEEEVPDAVWINYRYAENKLVYRRDDLDFRAIKLGDVEL